jgi:hypothetical protein
VRVGRPDEAELEGIHPDPLFLGEPRDETAESIQRRMSSAEGTRPL